MNRLKLCFLLFLGLLIQVHSAVFLQRKPFILGHKGECFDEQTKVFYKKGEEMEWREEGCGRKFCSGSYGIEIQTCGKAVAPPECYLESNLNLPYPKCCPWIICPTPSGILLDSENEIE